MPAPSAPALAAAAAGCTNLNRRRQVNWHWPSGSTGRCQAPALHQQPNCCCHAALHRHNRLPQIQLLHLLCTIARNNNRVRVRQVRNKTRTRTSQLGHSPNHRRQRPDLLAFTRPSCYHYPRRLTGSGIVAGRCCAELQLLSFKSIAGSCCWLSNR